VLKCSKENEKLCSKAADKTQKISVQLLVILADDVSEYL